MIALLVLLGSLLWVLPAWAGFTTCNANLPGRECLTFDTDMQIVANATQGQGWSSGGVLTAQVSPDMTVALTAGTGWNGQAGTSFITWAAQAALTIAAADADWPRIDLISVPFTGATPTPVVTTGVAYSAPVPPALPVNSGIQNLGLWYVLVPAGTATITSGLLMDKRMVIGSNILLALDTGGASIVTLRGTNPTNSFMQQNGTLAVPTATGTSDTLGIIYFFRYSGSAFIVSSSITAANTTGDVGKLKYSAGEHRFESVSGGSTPVINAQSGTYATEVTNAGSTGTTVNKIAKPTGAPTTAVIATTSDTSGVLGIVVAGAGTTGKAQIAVAGTATCVFDGATTAGHYVTVSTTTTGDCHDFGASAPTDGSTIIGRVLSTNGAGGTYAVLIDGATSPNASGSSPVTVTALTSDATANSTTTGVKITGLDTATATGTFTFQYFIRYQSAATTTGVKFGVNYSGTQTMIVANMRAVAPSGAITAVTQAAATPVFHMAASTRAVSTTAPNLGPTVSVDAATSDMLMVIEGLIIVTVAGNLELWHASEVAASSTVMTGSSLILTKTN